MTEASSWRMPQGQVGRAELMLAQQLCGVEAMYALAEDLQFARLKEAPEPKRPVLSEAKPEQNPIKQSSLAELQQQPQRPSLPDSVPFHYLRVLKDVRHDDVPLVDQRPAWYQNAEVATDQERHGDLQAKTPIAPPLVPWPRLWPSLRLLLGKQTATRYLEPRRAVAHIAQQQPLEKVPRRQRLSWAPHVQILLDLSDHLTPYRRDVMQLLQRLTRLRGQSGLDLRIIEPDIVPKSRRMGDSTAKAEKYRAPAKGTVVLVLGDLGCLSDRPNAVYPWRHIGRKLRRAGCPAFVLTPSRPRRWHRDLSTLWQALVWDCHASLRPCAMLGPACEEVAAQADPAMDELMALLYPLIRIEPAILRAIRKQLSRADAGCEAEVWQNHSHFAPMNGVIGWFSYARVAYQQAWQAQPEKLAGLRQLIAEYHGNLPASIWHVEQELLGATVSTAERHTATRLARWLAQRIQQKGLYDPEVQALRYYVHSLAQHLPEAIWRQQKGLAALYAACFLNLPKEQQPPRPDTLPPELLEGFYPANAQEDVWTFREFGQALEFLPAQSHNLLQQSRPSLVSRQGWLQFQQPKGKLCQQDLRQNPHIQLQPGYTQFRNHRQTLTLAYEPAPAWAQSIWRDRDGLHATVQKQGEDPIALTWLAPGPIQLRGVNPSSSWHLEQGRWLETSQWRAIQQGIPRPEWATAFGVDTYGIYADLSVKTASQRMRLILPDCFLMGSPEDELERDNDETQHQVLLTRAFWLADTACSQAFWQALMQQNPSHFKGGDLPVERVSWHDTQAMLAKLSNNKQSWRLPTEAEWEYACCAGTTTPFHFGATITTEQANYNGSYAYAQGHQGEFRNETVAVKHFEANAWGLYQMHGNVWEWCQDGYCAYNQLLTEQAIAPLLQSQSSTQVNSVATQETATRVLRGGCWFDSPRGLRSAYRDWIRPGDVSHNVGFRFALDAELVEHEAQQK